MLTRNDNYQFYLQLRNIININMLCFDDMYESKISKSEQRCFVITAGETGTTTFRRKVFEVNHLEHFYVSVKSRYAKLHKKK